MRKGAVAALALLVLAAAAAVVGIRRPAQQPRLVLLLVIDQLRYDYLPRFGNLYRGGFQKLTAEGAVFSNAFYRHGWTVTAAGHAAISTGLHPSHTGMVGNEWYDPVRGEGVNCVFDESAAPAGGAGGKASPRTLLADTLGDHLKRKHGGSKVVSVSWKDRAALLLAGREADAAYWFSKECGCFITSDYYGAEAPQWLEEWNRRRLPDQYHGKAWERLLGDEAPYLELARPDAFAGEGKNGVRNAFPHWVQGQPPEPGYYDDLGYTPFGDELVLEAALAALAGHDLGSDSEPDILAAGFSATDLIGHRYGPRSQEAMDHHLRLDRLLARLLEAVDARVGLDHTLIAMSADHGVTDLVEQLSRAGKPARRVPAREFIDAVEQAAAARFPGLGRVVAHQVKPHLYLDLPSIEAKGVARAEFESVAKAALLAHPGVESVYTHADLSRPPDPADPIQRLYRNSFFERRSPHLTIHLKPHTDPYGAHGTGHGTAYPPDRHVPLIVWGRWARRGFYEEPCGPEDLAPALGKILGLALPLERDGRLLREMLQ